MSNGTQKKMDTYVASLAEVIQRVEEVYELHSNSVGGVPIAKQEITSVMAWCTDFVKTQDRTLIAGKNREAGSAIALLPYVLRRLCFFNKKRLDYSRYPAMDQVASVLLKFTKADTVTGSSVNEINKIVQLLSEIDKKYPNFRGGLGYKFLRLFVLLVTFGNYVNASVVADLILRQFEVKE